MLNHLKTCFTMCLVLLLQPKPTFSQLYFPFLYFVFMVRFCSILKVFRWRSSICNSKTDYERFFETWDEVAYWPMQYALLAFGHLISSFKKVQLVDPLIKAAIRTYHSFLHCVAGDAIYKAFAEVILMSVISSVWVPPWHFFVFPVGASSTGCNFFRRCLFINQFLSRLTLIFPSLLACGGGTRW